jgi:large subunit ribosomal protein L21
LKGAHVTGEIVKHGLDDKIVVFKQKRRKNYAKKQGHRQKFTEVRIKDIAFGKKSGGEK